jgi:hypothetical protein
MNNFYRYFSLVFLIAVAMSFGFYLGSKQAFDAYTLEMVNHFNKFN